MNKIMHWSKINFALAISI